MNKIDNNENVKRIVMHPSACVKCQIGQDWYKCEFDVYFTPEKYYPDYMEVEKYVMENIDGKELNIEQAGKMLKDYLKQYEPEDLEVIVNVAGNKVHFDVEVTL